MLKHNTTWFKKVYIACGRTDLRLGVDGLATLIQSQFGMNALQEQVPSVNQEITITLITKRNNSYILKRLSIVNTVALYAGRSGSL